MPSNRTVSKLKAKVIGLRTEYRKGQDRGKLSLQFELPGLDLYTVPDTREASGEEGGTFI